MCGQLLRRSLPFQKRLFGEKRMCGAEFRRP
ncbi:hypothetical protein DNTS_018815 [Danionella cerebrum]|uniref:Uncharacterized protein n=1 Tax=Danionella cerebrum TaxID=2873325 RepID=A0A553N196_9TELE|nr:hypothetical protein DNTS_018815 [Danionella translucida]